MGQLFRCCVFHKIGDLKFGGKGQVRNTNVQGEGRYWIKKVGLKGWKKSPQEHVVCCHSSTSIYSVSWQYMDVQSVLFL